MAQDDATPMISEMRSGLNLRQTYFKNSLTVLVMLSASFLGRLRG